MRTPISISFAGSGGREPVAVATLRPGLTLGQALYAAGPWRGAALCQGLGRCGRCRVRYLADPPPPGDAELRLLDAADLAVGVRLACRHQARDGDRLELPPMPPSRPAEVEVLRNVAHGPVGLAVDLGTTTLEWRAVDQRGALAHGAELNPQMGAGSEVLSRLAYARTSPEGAGELRRAVLEALRRILAGLPFGVERLCLAGNTVMTHLALGLDAAGLEAAPYRLHFHGGAWHELGPGLPPAYVPPLWGPFVGGDVSAGLAALWSGLPLRPQEPFLLADLGTNGEFLLADGERLFAASVPMGPALEGVGPACGVLAQPGAMVGFALQPGGLAPRWYGGLPALRPAGVSGTGYLSLLALLRRNGLLDDTGRFAPGSTPLAERLAADISTDGRGEARLRLAAPQAGEGQGVYLAAGDVEEVLKVKAAFDAALSRLLAAAGLRAGELRAVCLAGALGRHADPADLEALGFLPPGLAARCRAVGNTSLEGAAALLADESLRRRLEGLGGRVQVLDLAADASFGRNYVQRMVFTHVG